MTPESYAQFEYHKMQLIGTLGQVATTMRECASVAEQFAQIVGNFSFNGNPPPFPALANGQYPMPIPPSLPAAEETGKKRKSRGGDDADGKRKKKLKDPNAPKRPPSSYLLFQNDVRNELKAKNPGMPNNELLGVISKLWAEMPQEQKDAYEARNRAAKEEWLSKKAVYESGKGVIAPPVPNVLPPVAVAPIPAKPPVVAPVAETSSSEESTVEEDDTEESSSDDDATAAPPPKKSKKEAAATAKDEVKKEKKHKKAKA